MARKLKAYITTSGFFELAVAAPSMKAALEIWGGKSNLFQQGFAEETDDAGIIKTTMEHPGVVLRRAVGSHGAFTEHAKLPEFSALQNAIKNKQHSEPASKKTGAKEPRRPNAATTRKAAQLYDLAQQRREREQQHEEAQREEESARRAQAAGKARAAFNAARARHEERSADLEKERDAIDRKARRENERWDSERARLEAALKPTQG